MKVSDDAQDQKNNILLGVVAAVICGITIGYLAVTNADAACIFLAILIGTVLALKVDCLNHILSLLIFIGIIMIFGFPTIGIITLAVCAAAAFLDEIGNDSKWAEEHRYVKEFFQYRFALKIVILLFTVLGTLATVNPELQMFGVQFFTPLTFICFLMFELSYEMIGLKFNAIYDRVESFLGFIRGVDRSAND